MPETWTPLLAVAVGTGVFLYGFSKTGVPGAGVLASPLLALALGPTVASGFVMPLLLVGDLFALARYRQHANWPLIVRLVPGVLVGIALTALLFRYVDTHALARIVGLLVLVSVGLEVWRRRRPEPTAEGPAPHRLAAGFFGTLAGMTTMAANSGGAAMQLYLLNMRVSMLAFMGTFAWFFVILNAIKVPILVGLGFLDLDTLRADLWFLPVVVAGALLGYATFSRLNERVFANLALALSAVAAIWLVLHG
jgi:uncharacterized membrane protein YfcA